MVRDKTSDVTKQGKIPYYCAGGDDELRCFLTAPGSHWGASRRGGKWPGHFRRMRVDAIEGKEAGQRSEKFPTKGHKAEVSSTTYGLYGNYSALPSWWENSLRRTYMSGCGHVPIKSLFTKTGGWLDLAKGP